MNELNSNLILSQQILQSFMEEVSVGSFLAERKDRVEMSEEDIAHHNHMVMLIVPELYNRVNDITNSMLNTIQLLTDLTLPNEEPVEVQ